VCWNNVFQQGVSCSCRVQEQWLCNCFELFFSGFHLGLGETGCSSFERTSIIVVCSFIFESLHSITVAYADLSRNKSIQLKLNLFIMGLLILFLFSGKPSEYLV